MKIMKRKINTVFVEPMTNLYQIVLNLKMQYLHVQYLYVHYFGNLGFNK